MPDVRTGSVVHVRSVNPMLAAQSAMQAANDGARASMQVSFTSILCLFCLYYVSFASIVSLFGLFSRSVCLFTKSLLPL